MKRLLIGILMFGCFSAAWATDPPEMRALYCAYYNTNTEAKCNTIVSQVLSGNYNAVFIQVRARGDANYVPNREDSTYPNVEPRGELYTITPSDLDVLQYFIDRFHNATPKIEVHAWLTTYNAWNRIYAPDSPNHVVNAHPEWITYDSAGNKLEFNGGSISETVIDPGIPAVQDYLFNVFMDVVRNYDIDGIHFDYIRLINANSGYNPTAVAAFVADTGFSFDPANPGPLDAVFKAWRRDQLAKLVQRIHAQTKIEKPWVNVSAFLVRFADPIRTLAQGFNWWVTHGAIDSLHLGGYAATVSTVQTRWNQFVNELVASGDENKVPLVCALGSWLYVDTSGDDGGVDEPQRHLDAIAAIRGETRKPDGFNFFDWAAIFTKGTPTYAADKLHQDLHAVGGPMRNWADIPAVFRQADQETLPPNPPASLSASIVSGKPRVTFNRPAAAGDGDLPVHYRLYRDTQTPVRRYFTHMVMEWWDLDSGRASFSYDDVAIGASGSYYYAAVAYDSWNNQAIATTGPVAVTTVNYIIENCAGMQNAADYSEPSGTFSNSSGHSTAPGCTVSPPNPASRFAAPGISGELRGDKQRFTPSIPTGTYEVYVTTLNYASSNALDITLRVSDAGGVETSLFDLTAAVAGNKWAQCATMTITSGQGHYIEFDNTTQSNFGDMSTTRMTAAAVRFVQIPGTPVAKEPKPPVAPSAAHIEAGHAVVIDSEPTTLNYDDGAGWATSTYSLSGTLHQGSSRYYLDPATLNSYAVFVADLPRAGRWAIDGYIRQEQGGLAQMAQYRFVSSGTVRSVVTTQRPAPGTAGFNINVDGVTDANAYHFDKGRVYVTVHGNSGVGGEQLHADALRFRLIEPDEEPSSVENWLFY